MTARQFELSLALCDFGSYDHAADINVFDGFGYSTFPPVYVSIDQVAALIAYQAKQMNGDYDQQALADIRTAGRNRFQIIERQP